MKKYLSSITAIFLKSKKSDAVYNMFLFKIQMDERQID